MSRCIYTRITYRSEALLLQEVATSNSTICAERTRSFIFHRRGGCTAVPIDATTLRYAHTAVVSSTLPLPSLSSLAGRLFRRFPPLENRSTVPFSRSRYLFITYREFVESRAGDESLKRVWKKSPRSTLAKELRNDRHHALSKPFCKPTRTCNRGTSLDTC